jgi:putative membrane protein
VSARRPPLHSVGEQPDARFTYANERTFLAWNRTALALIATGVAATQLLPALEIDFGRRLLGLPLIAMGAVLAIVSYRRWEANERAMRLREPLPPSPLPRLLALGIAVVAVLAIIIATITSPD